MKPGSPSIAALLGSDAVVLHSTKRPYFEKRMVKYAGNEYVLYRFFKREHLERLATALSAARNAGASLQPMLGMVDSQEAGHSGYWLSLVCLPGRLMTGVKFEKSTVESLGRTLARLNSVRGTCWAPLFRGHQLDVPYFDFLQRVSLGSKESRWVENSERAIRRIGNFQLVHGDLHGNNILIGPDEKAALIDYELFAYEPLGLELATAMLRPFCRTEKGRKLFHNAYLRASDSETRLVWSRCSHALLFAAAIRLADLRIRRQRFLFRKNLGISIGMRFTLDERKRSCMQEEIAKNLLLMEAASRAELVYLHLATEIVRFSLADPNMSAVTLVTASYLGLGGDAISIGE